MACCAHFHLKRRALNGQRDKLSTRNLAFVSVGVPSCSTMGSWHYPSLPEQGDGIIDAELLAWLAGPAG